MNVGLIGRMLERASEADTPPTPASAVVVSGRFARDPGHFAVTPPAVGAEGGVA